MDGKSWVAIGIEHPTNPVNVGTLMRTAAAFAADAVFTVGAGFGVEFGLKMLSAMQASDEPCCTISAQGGTCRCSKVHTAPGKVPGDTTKLSEGRLPLTTLTDIPMLGRYARSQDATIIGVERAMGRKLDHVFQHATRAIYLLGNEGTGLTKEAKAECHLFVEIDTLSPLNVATAAGIVLYHRQLMEGVTGR